MSNVNRNLLCPHCGASLREIATVYIDAPAAAHSYNKKALRSKEFVMVGRKRALVYCPNGCLSIDLEKEELDRLSQDDSFDFQNGLERLARWGRG